MRIAVIGPTGGGQLGALLARAGHEVVFAGRDRAKAARAAAAAGPNARTDRVADAAEDAGVVVLAVPYDRFDDAAREAGAALRGKVVVDTSNPVRVQAGRAEPVAVPDGLTAAAHHQRVLGPVRLVKAFNLICGSHDLAALAQRTGDQRAAVMYAGDDPAAKRIVATLVEDMNFVPFDVGALADAGVLEPDPETTSWVPLTVDETRRYLRDRAARVGSPRRSSASAGCS